MTIHTLRNLITVTEWTLSERGATISYYRKDKGNKLFHWVSTPIETVQGLIGNASIDDYTLSPLTVTNDNCTYTFQHFVKNYQLSQWEALVLAVRHEAEMEEAASMAASDLYEAFKEALK